MKNYFKLKYNRGFTVTEIVVAAAIISFLSAAILVSFTGIRSSATLNRSLRELAIAIRQTQSTALGVTVTSTQVPPVSGLKLSTATAADAKKYIVFSDLNDINGDTVPDGNLKYDRPPDVLVEEGVFEPNIRIKSLMVDTMKKVDTVHILFSSPEAAVSLTDDAGMPVGELLQIELEAPSGDTKKITVRISGQISIR